MRLPAKGSENLPLVRCLDRFHLIPPFALAAPQRWAEERSARAVLVSVRCLDHFHLIRLWRLGRDLDLGRVIGSPLQRIEDHERV